MVSLVRHGGDPPVVEIGRKGIIAGAGKAVGDPTDLVVEPPPLLNDDDTGAAVAGDRQVPFGLATIGAREVDHRTHRISSWSGIGKGRHHLTSEQLDRAYRLVMADRAEREIADVVIDAGRSDLARRYSRAPGPGCRRWHRRCSAVRPNPRVMPLQVGMAHCIDAKADPCGAATPDSRAARRRLLRLRCRRVSRCRLTPISGSSASGRPSARHSAR